MIDSSKREQKITENNHIFIFKQNQDIFSGEIIKNFTIRPVSNNAIIKSFKKNTNNTFICVIVCSTYMIFWLFHGSNIWLIWNDNTIINYYSWWSVNRIVFVADFSLWPPTNLLFVGQANAFLWLVNKIL